MTWITFAYSLSKDKSNTRVTLWRRLQRLGAVAPAGNLYVLPAQDECIEAFQWLTQEIQSAGGQAIMFYCEQIEGLSEQALIDLFCEARAKEYEVIQDEVIILQDELKNPPEDLSEILANLTKLRRQYADIARIDYFGCPQGKALENQLTQVEQTLAGNSKSVSDIALLDAAEFVGKTWVTRPQPYVDRLASIWLIRRFIDPDATIRYSQQPAPSEISFDMPNARFGHVGNLCTFEVLMASFGLAAGGLSRLAEIVHEIDLRDSIYHHPETLGIELLLTGWQRQGLSDEALEERGLVLFDGLLSAIRSPER